MRKSTSWKQVLLGVIGISILAYLYEGTDYAQESKYINCLVAAGGTEFAYVQCVSYIPSLQEK